MSERLLRKEDIARLLGTSKGVAAEILAKRGCHPIDFGRGAYRGQRWLESAVISAIRVMHIEAQPLPPKRNEAKPSPVKKDINLASKTASELYDELTATGVTQ